MSVRSPRRASPAYATPMPMQRRRQLLMGAMFVDMLGGGLFAPFELLYGHKVSSLPLTTAGLLLGAGAAAAIAVGPIAGAAVDRFGPVLIVAAANVLGVGGCLALLGWRNAWGFGAGAFLLSAALRTFYGAFTPFVASLAESGDLERWFGRIRAARYVGLAAGQGLSGVALAAGQVNGLRLIVALNAVSYVGALVLILLTGAGGERRAASGDEPEDGRRGYRAALADRANVAVAGLNVAATLLIIAPALAMPVFVLEHLHLSTWVPGVLAALTTATLAGGLLVTPRLLRGRGRVRNLAIANVVWVGGFLLFVLAALAPGAAIAALFAAMILLGFGEALYAPTADALPAALAPRGLQGRYAALHQMAWGVSETIAPAMAGFLLTTGDSPLWVVLALLATASVFAYRGLESRIAGRDGVAGGT